ncbi:hypothetical protein ACLOJK_006962 [Asimina triloba]
MISVFEDGNRRRDGSDAMYSQLRQSLIQLQEAADRIFDTISVRVRLRPRCSAASRYLAHFSFSSLALFSLTDYGRAGETREYIGQNSKREEAPDAVDAGQISMHDLAATVLLNGSSYWFCCIIIPSGLQGKIDAISRSNHPMMVKSPSTHPSKSTSEVDYHPLFSYKDGPDSAGFPVGRLFVDGGLNREFGVDGTLELFRFFTETSFESLPKEVCSKVCVE